MSEKMNQKINVEMLECCVGLEVRQIRAGKGGVTG